MVTARSTSRAQASPVPTHLGQPGTWYLQHTYQMRDTDFITLKAMSEDEAIVEGREVLKKWPHLEEPCIVFISTDRSLTYHSKQRL